MAFTSTQVLALEAAIAAGKLSVRMGDQTIVYQSIESMIKALNVMREEINEAAGTIRRHGVVTHRRY